MFSVYNIRSTFFCILTFLHHWAPFAWFQNIYMNCSVLFAVNCIGKSHQQNWEISQMDSSTFEKYCIWDSASKEQLKRYGYARNTNTFTLICKKQKWIQKTQMKCCENKCGKSGIPWDYNSTMIVEFLWLLSRSSLYAYQCWASITDHPCMYVDTVQLADIGEN